MHQPIALGISEGAAQDGACELRGSWGASARDHRRRHAVDVRSSEPSQFQAAEGRRQVRADVLLVLPPGRRSDALALQLQPAGQIVGNRLRRGRIESLVELAA